eukprot:6209901-Pleurochrysis_carterae.AAC.2
MRVGMQAPMRVGARGCACAYVARVMHYTVKGTATQQSRCGKRCQCARTALSAAPMTPSPMVG